MAYQKQTWNNNPSGGTPITAERMNHMEEGIANAVETDSVARVTNVVSRNLFDKNSEINFKINTIYSILDTGLRSIITNNSQYSYFSIKLDNHLLGKNITLTSNIMPSSNNKGKLSIFYGTKEEPFLQEAGISLSNTGSITGTLNSEFPSGCNSIFLLLYSNVDGTANSGDYVDYTNIQLEEGSVATPYTPYLNMQELQEKSNDTGWINAPLTSDASTLDWGKLSYRKINGIVYINGVFKLSNPSWGKAFATLPQGFRPKKEADFVCRGVDNIPVVVAITDSGQMAVLQLVTGVDFSSEVGGLVSCSFIADN